MSVINCPIHGKSLSNKPASKSFPNRLHITRRKYSCLGKLKNERLSVSMPINWLSIPRLEIVFSYPSNQVDRETTTQLHIALHRQQFHH